MIRLRETDINGVALLFSQKKFKLMCYRNKSRRYEKKEEDMKYIGKRVLALLLFVTLLVPMLSGVTVSFAENDDPGTTG